MTAIWRLQWAVALRRKRLLAWNVLVPSLLLVPVALSSAAAVHKAVVFTLFFVFFGAYGSCIPLIRDGGSGWAEKVLLTGIGPRSWLLQRVFSAVTLDVAQILPVSAALVWIAGGGFPEAATVLLAAAAALLFANLLGAVVAALVRSLAEAALGCALVSLFALHLAGVFRTPTPGTWQELAERLSPITPLHDAWIATLTAGDLPDSAVWVPALGMLVGGLIIFVALATPMGRRIAEIRAV